MTIFQKNKVIKTFTLHIFFSGNNTILTLLDFNANIKFTISCGQLRYKNSQKKNQATTQHLAFFVAKEILKNNIASVNLKIKGLSKGRNSIVKDLIKAGLFITNIHDQTPLSFNGCRIGKRSA